MGIKEFLCIVLVGLSASCTLADEKLKDLVGRIGSLSSQEKTELIQFGDQSVPLLIEKLHSSSASAWEKQASIFALGDIGSKDAVPVLIECLSRPETEWTAVISLGRIGEDAAPAVPQLIQILDKSNGLDVRSRSNAEWTIKALAKIGIVNDEVIASLEKQIVQNRNYEAARCLSQLGEPGVEKLIEMATAYLKDSRSPQKRNYGEAYSVLVNGEALPIELLPLLRKHLVAGDKSALVASKVIGNMGSAAKPTLIELLDSKDSDIRALAASGLADMNFKAQSLRRYQNKDIPDPVSSEEVFPKLVSILRDKKGEVDWRIFHAIWGIDTDRAEETKEIQDALAEVWRENIRKSKKD